MHRRLTAAIVALFVLAIFFPATGCRTTPPVNELPAKNGNSYRIKGQWYHPVIDACGFRQEGIASWYGAPFHGRKTASGETYNMHARTAAHKTLPLGTFVRVRSLENGKESIVRINDRGPFARGRIIDLSYRAAREIEMIGPGTARVDILALEKVRGSGKGDPGHSDFYTGNFTVQVGAFARPALAEKLRDKLQPDYADVFITPVQKGSETLYRVRVGRFTSLASAQQAAARLIQSGCKDAITVSGDDR